VLFLRDNSRDLQAKSGFAGMARATWLLKMKMHELKLTDPAMLHCFPDLLMEVKGNAFRRLWTGRKSWCLSMDRTTPTRPIPSSVMHTSSAHQEGIHLKKTKEFERNGDERVALPGFQESTRHRQDLKRH
jgi:hypothetical protein